MSSQTLMHPRHRVNLTHALCAAITGRVVGKRLFNKNKISTSTSTVTTTSPSYILKDVPRLYTQAICVPAPGPPLHPLTVPPHTLEYFVVSALAAGVVLLNISMDILHRMRRERQNQDDQ
jgi:hypothetical protein